MVDVTGASDVLDSLDMFGLAAGSPSRWPRRPRRPPASAGLPTAAEVDNVVVLGMGGSGRPATCWPRSAARSCRCRWWWPRATARRRSWARAPCASPCRSRATPRRRSRPPRRPRRGRPHGGGDVRAARWASWPPAGRRRTWVPDSIPQPRRLGALAVPLILVLEEVGLFPGAASGGRRGEPARDPPRRPAGRRLGPGDRPHDRAADPAGPRGRAAWLGGRQALEDAGQRERQGAGLRRRRPRAVPQRDRRVGPARRHDPAGVHAGRAPPRRGAPPGAAALRPGAS